MAGKTVKIYTCSKCGAQAPKWLGRCNECGAWGTMGEEISTSKSRAIKAAPVAEFVNLGDINAQSIERMATGIGELDRVLGGGLVAGSLTLLAGEPGVGKSTVLAQLLGTIIGRHEIPAFYISGEESAWQIKDRFLRLGLELGRINFLNETNSESVISALKKVSRAVVVLDSIQTVYTSLVASEAGSISQIRSVTMQFLELAKKNNIAVVIVGHITKDGQVAGPKTLEHMVDTVLYLESGKNDGLRLLRASKNRFGSVNEAGIFEMSARGLIEVKNPAAIFLESGVEIGSGSVISAIIKGTRPFMVEIQALVSKTIFGYPQRKASGFDLNRLQVLTAVLSKKGGLNLLNQDVVVNAVGGERIVDPALDLAVCLAIASSLLNLKISRKTLALGEVGLGGEVRNVPRLAERLSEAAKLGFEAAYVPATTKAKAGIRTIAVKNISEIVRL